MSILIWAQDMRGRDPRNPVTSHLDSKRSVLRSLLELLSRSDLYMIIHRSGRVQDTRHDLLLRDDTGALKSPVAGGNCCIEL